MILDCLMVEKSCRFRQLCERRRRPGRFDRVTFNCRAVRGIPSRAQHEQGLPIQSPCECHTDLKASIESPRRCLLVDGNQVKI